LISPVTSQFSKELANQRNKLTLKIIFIRLNALDNLDILATFRNGTNDLAPVAVITDNLPSIWAASQDLVAMVRNNDGANSRKGMIREVLVQHRRHLSVGTEDL
jgi:hypothetical protein